MPCIFSGHFKFYMLMYVPKVFEVQSGIFRDILRFCLSHLRQSLDTLSGGYRFFIYDMSKIIIKNCIKTIFIVPLCIGGKNI